VAWALVAALLLETDGAMKASERETRTAATRRRKYRVCFAILLLLLDVQGRKRGFDQDRGCWIGDEAGS